MAVPRERDLATQALVALADVHRILMEALEKRLRSTAGLSFAQFEVLARLDAAPDHRLRMVDIADQVCVSRSGVTLLVDRLEESGFVAREASPSDRRLTFAALTERGIEVVAQAEPVLAEALHQHFVKHLSEAQIRSLRGSLIRVLEGNGVVEPSVHPPMSGSRP